MLAYNYCYSIKFFFGELKFMKQNCKIRILLADDSKLIRQGLKAILEFEKDFDVIAEAEDGPTTLQMTELHKPDVILMDVSMPVIDGVKATSMILVKFPSIKIIGLSLYDEDEMVSKMLNAGAVSFVSKTNACDNLADVIRSCCNTDCLANNTPI
jgi:DNA-binding NarL/FixJ family response regulator